MTFSFGGQSRPVRAKTSIQNPGLTLLGQEKGRKQPQLPQLTRSVEVRRKQSYGDYLVEKARGAQVGSGVASGFSAPVQLDPAVRTSLACLPL